MSEIKELSNLPKEWQILTNPPQRMFYKGHLELLDKNKIAIIGSRKMSVYTKNVLLELAFKLAQKDICVVSGGALGVDITAASAAMPLTIGIFANGLEEIYPKNNAKIIQEIYQKGLALSEYEGAYLPQRHDFLHRNRLIIALCEKIIIAQADFQSGSMQSARLARELGKEVFVLPQRIYESKGTNALLARGEARLISDIDGFIKDLVGVNLKESKSLKTKDPILAFCENGASLDEALKLFKEKIYEYELLGKIIIEGVTIRPAQ